MNTTELSRVPRDRKIILCKFITVTKIYPKKAHFFFFNDTATTEIYTLSLHDALPISLIAVDPDLFDASNLERVHGSEARDVAKPPLKVELQRRHLLAINPALKLITIRGCLPQHEVLDAQIGRAHV